MIRQLFTLVTIVSCFFFITACKQNQASDKPDVTEDATEKDAPASFKYPALGNQDLSLLYAKADKVDIIFYNLPSDIQLNLPIGLQPTLILTGAGETYSAEFFALAASSWLTLMGRE